MAYKSRKKYSQPSTMYTGLPHPTSRLIHVRLKITRLCYVEKKNNELMASYTVSSGVKSTLTETTLLAFYEPLDRYDIVVRFLSAEDLPKMDVIGHADPYFIANIDDHTSYTSFILSNTSVPKWDDEEMVIRNIPINAKLSVVLYDKDDQKLADDYIGQFEIVNLINYHAPTNGHDIIDRFGHYRGRFHLSIQSIKSSDESRRLPAYTFDGPCRYFRHDSLAIGRLTMLNADCVYSTWKIQMKRLSFFFPPHERQHWNRQYQTAKLIFDGCPLSIASIAALKLAHKVLFGTTLKHNENGRLNSADDLWKLVFTDKTTKKIKPGIYTYVIDDHTWRFSETEHRFFTDLASKHALLANGSEYVRYAGEFHPRPKYGWNRCDEEWELVFDNGSGTYTPNAQLFTNLKEFFLFNFPGLNIITYDYKDPQLKQSLEQLKVALKKYKDSAIVLDQLVLDYSSPL